MAFIAVVIIFCMHNVNARPHTKIVKAIDSIVFCLVSLHWNWKFNGGLLVRTAYGVCVCVWVWLLLAEWASECFVCKHIFIVHCNSNDFAIAHIILRIHWKSPVFGCSLKREKRSISKSSTAVEPKNFIFAFYFIVLAKKKNKLAKNNNWKKINVEKILVHMSGCRLCGYFAWTTAVTAVDSRH